MELLRFHAAGLYLDSWKQWIVPGEMARAEAQASRAAAGVIDTVLDALLASAVAVIEKDTLFHCVAEQIVERLPEGRRYFGHLCKGPQRVVCGDGGVADPCAALGVLDDCLDKRCNPQHDGHCIGPTSNRQKMSHFGVIFSGSSFLPHCSSSFAALCVCIYIYIYIYIL